MTATATWSMMGGHACHDEACEARGNHGCHDSGCSTHRAWKYGDGAPVEIAAPDSETQRLVGQVLTRQVDDHDGHHFEGAVVVLPSGDLYLLIQDLGTVIEGVPEVVVEMRVPPEAVVLAESLLAMARTRRAIQREHRHREPAAQPCPEMPTTPKGAKRKR